MRGRVGEGKTEVMGRHLVLWRRDVLDCAVAEICARRVVASVARLVEVHHLKSEQGQGEGDGLG